MAKLLSCVLGPRLYKIYRERDTDRAASSVPETPTAVPASSSSSWVSRVPPPAEDMVRSPPRLPLAARTRPLSAAGEAACQAVAQSACGRFSARSHAGPAAASLARSQRLRPLPPPRPSVRGWSQLSPESASARLLPKSSSPRLCYRLSL